jgi:hypothetical protein
MSASTVPSAWSASSAAPLATPGPSGGDVVDLTSARQARHPQTASWFCPTCDLVAEGFGPTECAYLATIHDQLQHGSRPTAHVVVSNAAPVPPPTRSLDAGLGIGA